MSFKGITEGLRVLNQPIDALARLPQDQIIAMSQQPAGSPNRIPPDYVATILKAKADMAQAAANMQAMAQPSQPSIVEQSMAINAQTEAPQQAPMDTGVASLPVPEEMYSSDYAGGGIVAFDEGGMAGTFDSFMPNEAQYDEFSSYQPMFPSIGAGNRRYQLKQLGYTNDQIASMTDAQQNYVLKNVSDRPQADVKSAPAATVSAEAAPAAPVVPAKAPARESGIAAIPKGAAPAAKPDYLTKLQEMLKKAGVTDTDQEDLAAIQQGRSKLEDDKFDALRMSLIRAGLGMAAGTSPYALSNIAKGGIEGFETYDKSTKEIKAERKEYDKIERDLRKAANLRKRGEVEKALDLEEKAEDREIKLKGLEYQRISATKQSPEEIRMNFFRNDPEGFKRYMESQRSGFETADISRIKAGLEALDNQLLGMKPGPERDKLVQERKRLFDMLVPKPAATAGGSVDRNNPLLKGG
jgi:hypothetical protein